MILNKNLGLVIKSQDSNKNSYFVITLFVTTLLFQATGLKFIWSLESVARIANFLVLGVLIIYTLRVIGFRYYSKKVWYFYLLPGLLIFGGMFINITINTISDFKLISFYGLTLPWITYLIIPELIKKEAINTQTLWRYYYLFMLWANLLGIIDYVLAFYGTPNLRILTTPYGVFLGGSFSLLHMLADGTAHYRYYACFMEPGSLAMLLLPAISYAIYYKKYFGLLIFLPAFFLTDSLGGIISLIILAAIISFVIFNRKKNYLIYALVAFIAISILLWLNLGENIRQQYKEKGSSAESREEGFTKSITTLPIMVITYPIGFKLEEDTKSFEKNKLFTGTNFQPATYLQYGGVIALIGYLICLFVSFAVSLTSILRNDLSPEEKVVFSSLLVMFPFLFQRTTIWESALFALLFAPSVLVILQKNINKTKTKFLVKAKSPIS